MHCLVRLCESCVVCKLYNGTSHLSLIIRSIATEVALNAEYLEPIVPSLLPQNEAL